MELDTPAFESDANSSCCLIARKRRSVLISLLPTCPGSPQSENKAIGRLAPNEYKQLYAATLKIATEPFYKQFW